MPYYGDLRVKSSDVPAVAEAKRRGARNLLRLKTALDKGVPEKKLDGTLLLATWNLREFGEGNFREWAGKLDSGSGGADEEEGMKGRLAETLRYIAEIANRFDLIALQEIRDDLEDMNELKKLLGAWWSILVTDVTGGRQGNRERVAFLFDERKVRFGGLAGEVVLPPLANNTPALQICRTPYIVGFKAGWMKFTICSTHLYYGQSKADDPQRLREMDQLAGHLKEELGKKTAWAKNTILLGDFNIFSTSDEQFKVLTQNHGFRVPKKVFGQKTNTGLNKPYDQIAFIAPDQDRGDRLDLANAGVFPFFDHVFSDADEAEYAPLMGEAYLKDKSGNPRTPKARTQYYQKWRTYQMSDHNPLWIELKTDFSPEYLTDRVAPS